jgi:hypothetical protein
MLPHNLVKSLVELPQPDGNIQPLPGLLKMNGSVGDHRELASRSGIDNPIARYAGPRVKTKNTNVSRHQNALSCGSSSLFGMIVTFPGFSA